MECRLCKGYIYNYSSVQLQPATMPLYFDDDLFERYKNYTDETELIPVTNISANDPPFWKKVNDFVGANIFNKTFNMYVNDTNEYPYSITKQNIGEILGFKIDPVTNPGNNGMSFVTLTGLTTGIGCPAPLAMSFAIYTPFIGGTVSISNPPSAEIHINVFPHSDIGENGKIANREGITFKINFVCNSQFVPQTYRLRVRYNPYAFGSDATWLANFNINDTQPSEVDPDNPYADPDDDPGGDGPNLDPQTDPTDFPELPTEGIGDCGLFTIYRPTLTELQSLGDFLWTGIWDLNNFKKLFINPMDCIVGLALVPASPELHTGKNIHFGNVDTEILCGYVTTQYCSVGCGSVTIQPKIKDFLDYEATKVSIFLPYIGFRELSTRDVMNETITVQYNVDVLSGACAAFVKVGSKGVMYAFNGSCISNVPLTATNFSGAIQNAVSAVASGAGVVAGAVSGAAPITAMSAASLVSSAANTLLNSKPNIQRSGNLGGSAGIMSGKKPFVIIERPTYSVPDFYQNYMGRMCNKTAKLGSLSGFTMVDQIHLEGVTATPAEVTEIETMLKAGVII